MTLRPGLYDQPVTVKVDRELRAIADELTRVDAGAGDGVGFARVLHERLVRVLESLPAEGRVAAQVTLVNALMAQLEAASAGAFLKWSGLRLVRDELHALCKRGELRVLTTAYMGARFAG